MSDHFTVQKKKRKSVKLTIRPASFLIIFLILMSDKCTVEIIKIQQDALYTARGALVRL